VQADLALYIGYWLDDHKAILSKERHLNSDTVCVDWKGIVAWSRTGLLPEGQYKVELGFFDILTKEASMQNNQL
jgi:hypothetical protein